MNNRYFFIDHVDREMPFIVRCTMSTVEAFAYEDSILESCETLEELRSLIAKEHPSLRGVEVERYDQDGTPEVFVGPQAVTLVFLGRNTENILKDVFENVEGTKDSLVRVITRTDDLLPIPPGMVGGTIRDIELEGIFENYPKVTVVCNGGTTSQLIGTVRFLEDYEGDVDFVEVDRDGKVTFH